MNLTIFRQTDELHQQSWSFWADMERAGQRLILDSWYAAEKTSTRKKLWEIKQKWSRMMRRDSTVEQPPIPQDVVDEARERIIEVVKQMPFVTEY